MSGEGGKVRYKMEKKGRAFSINPPIPHVYKSRRRFLSFPLLLGDSVTWCFLLFNVKILSSFSRRRDWKESLFFIFFFFVKNFTLHKRGKGNRDIVSIPSSRIIEELKILLSARFSKEMMIKKPLQSILISILRSFKVFDEV